MSECHLCEQKAEIFGVQYNYKEYFIFPLPKIQLCKTCHTSLNDCDWCECEAKIFNLALDPKNPIRTCKPKKLKLCGKCYQEYLAFHRDVSRYHI